MPRAGSSIVCTLLGNIARQKYGHKNVLYEYFNPILIDKAVREKYVEYKEVRIFDDLVIVPVEGGRIEGSSADLRAARLAILRNNPKHTIKVFPSDLTDDIWKFIQAEYDLIFLERRDRVEQFLSLCYIMHTQKTHFQKTDISGVGSFPYAHKYLSWFIEFVREFNYIKDNNEGISIYYEDFMSLGGDQQALVNLLGLSGTVLNDCNVLTKPTPYEISYENLLSNKAEWLEHKQYVIDTLSGLN